MSPENREIVVELVECLRGLWTRRAAANRIIMRERGEPSVVEIDRGRDAHSPVGRTLVKCEPMHNVPQGLCYLRLIPELLRSEAADRLGRYPSMLELSPWSNDVGFDIVKYHAEAQVTHQGMGVVHLDLSMATTTTMHAVLGCFPPATRIGGYNIGRSAAMVPFEVKDYAPNVVLAAVVELMWHTFLRCVQPRVDSWVHDKIKVTISFMLGLWLLWAVLRLVQCGVLMVYTQRRPRGWIHEQVWSSKCGPA